MAATHHVYLIPGLFGFVNFWRLVYVTRVRELLSCVRETAPSPATIHLIGQPPHHDWIDRDSGFPRPIAGARAA